MNNPKYPSYGELISLNPLLMNNSEEDVMELVHTMKDIGYLWDNRSKRFYHPDTGKYIRTQGLDLFTPKSIKELFEEELNEVRNMPYISQGAGRFQQIWVTLTKRFLVAGFLLLTIGWFFLSAKIIFYLIASMIAYWIVTALITNLLHKPLRDFRDREMRKNLGNSDNIFI